MSYRDGALFELLPAIHRIRDAEEGGGALEALIAVLGEQADVLDENLRELYDSWFIETCPPWVVPYLGELLRVRDIHDLGHGDATIRSYVANTLRYRRRKGSVAVIEELARDVTGWQARAAEFFLQLGATQHLNHVRSDHHRTPDFRNAAVLGHIDGPFDTVGHTVDVRRIESARGRHNILNIGIFLWRLEAYKVEEGSPRPVSVPADGRYHFSPLGFDSPLFNQPDTEEDITTLADEVDVPGELLRRPLAAEADARRQTDVDGEDAPQGFLRDESPAVEVFTQTDPDDPFQQVPTDEIQICDLADLTPGGDWRRPGTSKSYTPADGGVDVLMPIQVAVDPERGRLAFPTGVVPNDLRVSYAYGFSGDLGGGPYPRRDEVPGWEAPRAGTTTFRAVVTTNQDHIAADATLFKATLDDAVSAWHTHISSDPDSYGVIAFADSASYEIASPPLVIRVPEGARIALVAGDAPASGGFLRRPRRPHVTGDVQFLGLAPPNSASPGRALIDGLLIEGDVTVRSGNLGELHLLHSTVTERLRVLGTPARPNEDLEVTLVRSISGPLRIAEGVETVSLKDSIVHGAATAIDAPGVEVAMDSVTVAGATEVGSLTASNGIFTGFVQVQRAQVGCIRFSYVRPSPSNLTPRRYRCQPDLALVGVTDPAEQDKVEARVVPVFTSLRYWDPGFGQLGRGCAIEISEGAEDEAEMGAFRFLLQPQRRENLDVALGEYLRFGMEAGVFYVT